MNEFEQMKVVAAIAAHWYLTARVGLITDHGNAATDHAEVFAAMLEADEILSGHAGKLDITVHLNGQRGESIPVIIAKTVQDVSDADEDSWLPESSVALADAFLRNAEGIVDPAILAQYMPETLPTTEERKAICFAFPDSRFVTWISTLDNF